MLRSEFSAKLETTIGYLIIRGVTYDLSGSTGLDPPQIYTLGPTVFI